MKTPPAPSRRERWIAAGLAVFAFALFARSLGADFLRWDDRQNILMNPWIENTALSLIWTRPYYNMYIPVTYTLWTALWHVSPEPWIFHLANVLFHAANTAMVYLISRRLFEGNPRPRAAAALTAMAFACHPLQVEVVAWISTFRDTLACFFTLVAFYLFMRKSSWIALGSATLSYVVALLCKPSVAVFPVALIAIGYGFKFLNRRKTAVAVAWLIPALIASYVTKRVQQLDADLRLVPMGLGQRLLVAVDTLTFYASKVAVPYPLAADYGRTRDVALADNLWPVGLAALAILGVGVFWFRKRIPGPFFHFSSWTLLFIAPVLGIIPFQAQGQTTVADRYMYMSMIGVGLMLGMVATARRWLVVAGAGLIAVWSAMTLARAEVWQTNEGFFTDMLAKNSDSHVALSSLGVEYILTGRLDPAERVLKRAQELRPIDVIPRTNMAQLHLLRNRPDLVLSETVPLLNNPEFLRVNQTETRALASAYRLAARAHWHLRLWTGANDYFCRWFNLDYENEDGKAEISRFLEEAKRAGARIENCQVQVRR